MNKEEKILSLRNAIKLALVGLDQTSEGSRVNNELQLRKQAYELLLGILSLPQRTIETLEVGDYVEYSCYSNHELKGIIEEDLIDDLIINGISFPKELIGYSKIIPHEAIELLKEVIGNE